LADLLLHRAFWCGVGLEGPATINEKGLGWCWQKIVIDLSQSAHEKFPEAEIQIDNAPHGHLAEAVLKKAPYVKFVKNGDDTVYQIAAASLVAKAHRDRIMVRAANQYPGYLWGDNKGYGTPAHIKAIREFGLTPLHRVKAVQRALNPKAGKILDPSQEAAEFSPAKAKEYVERAKAAGLRGDWEIKYIEDMEFRLTLQAELSPRQKFFLQRLARRAEHRSAKGKKA
jgi:ribonuclease HII